MQLGIARSLSEGKADRPRQAGSLASQRGRLEICCTCMRTGGSTTSPSVDGREEAGSAIGGDSPDPAARERASVPGGMRSNPDPSYD